MSARQLSDDQFQHLAALIKASDSAVQALDVDPLDGELRQVYFFDTPELSLFERE